ncbi:MAG: hypothetical protein NTY68_03195 [Candidatus Micrarchaeota archaeon]|nr:hypothetical protein [Candidatus Micrarchaeota archaeon]
MEGAGRSLVVGILLLFLLDFSFAKTTCDTDDCKITITISIAFAGATDAQIGKWSKEISDVWNGDGKTTGDCKCPVIFKVNTTKVANCTPIPQGYHCVNVIPWNNSAESLPQLPAGPKAGERVTGYMGKTTQSPSVNGASLDGDWSDQMSRLIDPNNPDSGNYADAAHEAGHMMGLNDGEGGIMNFTSGANATPSQGNIDNAVARVCGPNACPDSCCCGNGVVENNKNEKCDPMAQPSGCGAGESCCPVCCSCFAPLCIAAWGEYLDQASCQAGCGPGASCYYNYQTGCWDCIKYNIAIERSCLDPTNIRGNPDCDHPKSYSIVKQSNGTSPYATAISSILTNERLNIRTKEGDSGYLVTHEGELVDYGNGLLEDPTATIYTDRKTISLISSGELSLGEALSGGDVKIDGEGIWNAIRFEIYKLLFSLFGGFGTTDM